MNIPPKTAAPPITAHSNPPVANAAAAPVESELVLLAVGEGPEPPVVVAVELPPDEEVLLLDSMPPTTAVPIVELVVALDAVV